MARAVASAWVARNVAPDPAFRGAFCTGSAITLPTDAPLPGTSDVDVTVVMDEHAPRSPRPLPPGKRLVDGILLDVSFVTASALVDPVRVARSFVYAPSFRGGHVLADPTGHLGRLEAAIAPGFTSAAATRARTDDVRRRIRTRLTALDPATPWPELVLAWLFPTSLTAVVALVAALRPPTVRLRYLRARDVLPPDEYKRLLAVLGCADSAAGLVAHHLNGVGERFDEAAAALGPAHRARAAFPFAADLMPEARPVAVDGSRALVDRGDHREAVFWIVATAARCQAVLAAFAPAASRAREAEFRELVADLTGLHAVADVLHRRDALLAALPNRDEGWPPSAT